MKHIDFREIKTKGEFHEKLKELIDLPDYYGNNLDALHDVLSEVGEKLELNIMEPKLQECSEEIAKLVKGLKRLSQDIVEENPNVIIKWLNPEDDSENIKRSEREVCKEKKESIETICVQGGYTPENGEPRQIPIIQSTTFKYATGEEMGKLFDLEAAGYFYTRLQNPTNDLVAAKIAALEGGTAAMLTSSGQAANFFALFNICEAGDHIVSSSTIYGGTFNLISVTMAKMGIEATFISPDATDEELEAAFRPNTKAVFGETLANPALTVLDIEKFAKAAHSHGVPLIIDNTFPTPINCRPIEWGADIVTHSTTKYMDGHGVAVGGAIVDGGKFDWMAHKDKFPGLTTPDDSYHGIVYAEKFGMEGAFITKCTAQLMRDFGSIQSPQHAFYLNLGLESLHVRMPKHVENGQAVAEFLSKNHKVLSVSYPGLPGNKYYDLAMKYMGNGGCGVVSFVVDGGREGAEKFMNALKLAAIETHVADARTCCLNPATTTHRQMTDEQLEQAGIPAGLVRMSCGLEDKEDLIADIAQALELI
ncbi:MAG: PLP-dependent transferase [Firmicutes bacterium]|nr:PLP-dependent transferase [Bacillota bacterium]